MRLEWPRFSENCQNACYSLTTGKELPDALLRGIFSRVCHRPFRLDQLESNLTTNTASRSSVGGALGGSSSFVARSSSSSSSSVSGGSISERSSSGYYNNRSRNRNTSGSINSTFNSTFNSNSSNAGLDSSFGDTASTCSSMGGAYGSGRSDSLLCDPAFEGYVWLEAAPGSVESIVGRAPSIPAFISSSSSSSARLLPAHATPGADSRVWLVLQHWVLYGFDDPGLPGRKEPGQLLFIVPLEVRH